MKKIVIESPSDRLVWNTEKHIRELKRVASARLVLNGTIEATGATMAEAIENLKAKLAAEVSVS